jgi:ribonucleoside-diphosphate reductase alpha chain
MSEETKTDLYQEGLDFIKMVERSKYCINDNEKSWIDIVNDRFFPIITNHFEDNEIISGIMNILLSKKFITGGGITFGYGNEDVNCSLSNCYFTPIEEDSIEEIMDCAKRMSRTYSYRGGTGTDITILRPKNAKVKNAALTSSGSVSFMPTLSNITTTIGQNGRRGALIISLDCRHPDIEDFIWSKSDPEKVFGKDPLTGKVPDVYGANISVKITEEFMQAVKNDADWDLIFPDYEADKKLYKKEWDGDLDEWISKGHPIKVYKTVKAKDLLKQMSEASHMTGDPGILFWDNVINQSTGKFDKDLKPRGVNPCGEQPLANYGNCLLSAINLPAYVEKPWADGQHLNLKEIENDMKYIVRYMDHLIDVNTHPLEPQTKSDLYGRRIGIEITGLADVLAMVGIRYSSDSAISFVNNLQRTITISAIKESIELAKEKGSCPALKEIHQREKFLQQPFMKKVIMIEPEIFELIMEYGCRNTDWTTVGPTGTISMIADNCTSGVEPLYAMEYYRETRINPGVQSRIVHFPILKWIKENDMPDWLEKDKDELKFLFMYEEAFEIPYENRIRFQGALQDWVSTSISSTINLPEDATPEEINKIYYLAYEHNLKGVTVFRHNCKKGVLSVKEEKKEEKKELTMADLACFEKELLNEERAVRHRIIWMGKAKIYINVSVDDEGNPLEIFARVPKEVGDTVDGNFDPTIFLEKMSYWDTICRLVSINLRRGVDLEEIIKQLDKSSYGMYDLSAIIARILKQYPLIEDEDEEEKREYYKKVLELKTGDTCPNCQEDSLIHEGPCSKCLSCSYDKCG